MSLDLFRLAGGIDIVKDDLTSHANILQGVGAPGADAGQQDAAPVGSLFLRTNAELNNQQVYWKVGTANTAADWKQGTSKDYVDALVNGLSWRPPVTVLDPTVYATSAAIPVTGTIDGVVLSDLNRVLFTNITAASNSNVWIWHAGTTSWTQDTHLATISDAVLVNAGTQVSTQWVFNGTSWVQFGGAADHIELGYIRAFDGKSAAGNITPTYTAKYLFADTTSLLGSFNTLETALGVGTITHVGGNYVLGASLAFVGANGANGSVTITAAINDLNTAIGDRTYTTGTNYPIVASAQTVATSVEALNVAIHSIHTDTLSVKGSVSATPATFATIDTIAFALADEIKWLVQVRDTATPANIRATEVHAVTDGTTVDFARFADLTLGTGVAGFGLQVVISGTDVVLQVKATANYDYSIKRVAISKF